ncbi:MAG TPA: hypothetical protein VGD56_22480 [Gemmatirosa sp.]
MPFSTSFWTHNHRTHVAVRGIAALEGDAVVLECHATRRPDRRARRWMADGPGERVDVVHLPLLDLVAVSWRPRRIRIWRGGALDLVVRRLGVLEGVVHVGGPRCLLRVDRRDRQRAREFARAVAARVAAAHADRALSDELRDLLGSASRPAPSPVD